MEKSGELATLGVNATKKFEVMSYFFLFYQQDKGKLYAFLYIRPPNT